MLIEFSVTNFLSIKDKQTLSMAASSHGELKETNTFDSGQKTFPRLLRSAVIYGPNAAGKSNLLKALQLMRKLVISSNEGQEDRKLGITPFLLDKADRTKPSEFEIIFVDEGRRYQYGFAATDDFVSEEWLLAYPHGRPQQWIERKYDPAAQRSHYGSNLNLIENATGQKKVWEVSTKKNSLFLSTAASLESPQLKVIVKWFQDKLQILSDEDTMDNSLTRQFCKTEDVKSIVLNFIRRIDSSIIDIKITENESKGLLSSIMFMHNSDFSKNIQLIHQFNKEDETIAFNLSDESTGFQKIFALAAPWLYALMKGQTMAIDELNNSMHPLLTHALISSINDSESNKNNAQLIVTTHDTTLLDTDILRRDQIWFFEKDKHNASNLYSLLEFKPRVETDLAKNYLMGRYGAIPFYGDAKF